MDQHDLGELNRSRLACLPEGVVRTVRKLPLLPYLVDAQDDVLIADMDPQPQTGQWCPLDSCLCIGDGSLLGDQVISRRGATIRPNDGRNGHPAARSEADCQGTL
jgi:hypothetical protein